MDSWEERCSENRCSLFLILQKLQQVIEKELLMTEVLVMQMKCLGELARMIKDELARNLRPAKESFWSWAVWRTKAGDLAALGSLSLLREILLRSWPSTSEDHWFRKALPQMASPHSSLSASRTAAVISHQAQRHSPVQTPIPRHGFWKYGYVWPSKLMPGRQAMPEGSMKDGGQPHTHPGQKNLILVSAKINSLATRRYLLPSKTE